MKEKMTLPLKKAIRLLKKKASLINRSRTWDDTSCPIASAYGVKAVLEWCNVHPADREKLIAAGWNSDTYHAFIEWHDTDEGGESRTYFPNRNKFLKILGKRKNK